MKNIIGLKVGSKYGFVEIKSLIEKGIGWGFNFFEITSTDIDDLEYLLKLKNKGIKFGIHMSHAYTRENPMALSATIEPYKSLAKKWLKKSVKIAEELDAEYLIIHPDLWVIPKGITDYYKDGIIFAKNRKDGYKQLLKNIKNYNSKIPLLIEVMPHSRYYNYNLKTSLKIQKLTNVQFCFDIDHAFEVDGKINSVINWYQGIKNYVKVFHICDYDKKIRGHLPIGDGNIDFKKFFQSVEINKDQIFILEVLPYSKETIKKDLIGSKLKLEELLKN